MAEIRTREDMLKEVCRVTGTPYISPGQHAIAVEEIAAEKVAAEKRAAAEAAAKAEKDRIAAERAAKVAAAEASNPGAI